MAFNPRTALTVSYVVEGRGEFPRDMLRRDHACGLTDADQRRIDAKPGEYDCREMARVAVISADPRCAPLTERWESFGWRVVECEDAFRVSRPRVSA